MRFGSWWNITASNVSVVCGIPPEVLDALVKSRTGVLEELVGAHRETISLLKEVWTLTSVKFVRP